MTVRKVPVFAHLVLTLALGAVATPLFAQKSFQFRVPVTNREAPPPSPKFETMGNSPGFAAVTYGQDASDYLVIRNIGTGPGTPKMATTTGFSASTCGTLEPQESCEVRVTFTPDSSPREYTGSLSLVGGDPLQAVALTGIGQADHFSGQVATGGRAFSPSGNYGVVMQQDCNLVLYHAPIAPLWSATWASGTHSMGVTQCGLSVGESGRLEVRAPDGSALWKSPAPAQPYDGPTWLGVNDSGELQLFGGTYPARNIVLWSVSHF